MTYNTTNPGGNATTGNRNSPSHYAYHVREREGQKGYWTRIGSAWQHADGQGLSVHLDCVPVDGRLSLRVASDAERRCGAAGRGPAPSTS